MSSLKNTDFKAKNIIAYSTLFLLNQKIILIGKKFLYLLIFELYRYLEWTAQSWSINDQDAPSSASCVDAIQYGENIK